MNGDLKIKKSTTRAVLPKKPSPQANEKENTGGGEALRAQKKTASFNFNAKAVTMDFRRRIKSDCGAMLEPQRAPLCDLQINLPEKNVSKRTVECGNKGARPPKGIRTRLAQHTISSMAKVKQSKQECKEAKQQLNNEKPKIPSEQFNMKITKQGIKLNEQQKKLKSEMKQIETTSHLPALTFTSTLSIQLASSAQEEARCRSKSLNIEVLSSNIDCSSPIVTVKPIVLGMMSPIKPNVLTNEQTLLAQCVPKPIARKETLAHNVRNNRRIYEQLVLYKNFYVSDYSEDIIAYLLQNERRHMVEKHYLQIYDVNPTNRARIVNWLQQIQGRYRISINTYLLGIRLFDALLAAIPIPKNMYQLISLTLLWIIHKFDSNTRIIEVENLISDCHNVYNRQQILHMEQKVLKFFNFDYNLPEPTPFIFYYAENLNIKDETLIQSTCYILESYTLTEEYSTEPPSLLAAAALQLTIKILFTFSDPEVENLWKKLENCLGYHHVSETDPVKTRMQVQIQKINNAEYEFPEIYNRYTGIKWFHIFQIKLHDLKKNLHPLPV